MKATIEDMCKGYSIDTVDMDELEDRIESGIKYGDIGRMTLGRWGLGMVNTALLITQFFFCTGYFIFLGNTIASLFPAVKSEHHISGNASFHPHNHSVNGSMTSEGGDDHVKTTAPPFPLLLLVPLVPLVLMAYIRNVRKLGPVSFIANISLLIAFLSVISYMLSGKWVASIYLWTYLPLEIAIGTTEEVRKGVGVGGHQCYFSCRVMTSR